MATAKTDLSSYKMIHTMIRVKDPKRSMDFYKCLGLSQVNQLDIVNEGFSLYYMAYDGPGSHSSSRHWTDRSGVIELTHHYGTENDPSCNYSSGNESPYLGFGHVTILVDSLGTVSGRLKSAGFSFPSDAINSGPQGTTPVTDPDGYQVRLGHRSPSITAQGSRVSFTMLRIKDPAASLKFYKEVLGMALLLTNELQAENQTEYYLAYTNGRQLSESEVTDFIACDEGLVKLVWIHGTEREPGQVYHSGNSEPKGFGHLCVSVDDLDSACERFESFKLQWPKRLNDTAMNDMAFMTDPDGYWVEVLQNEVLKPRAHW